MGMVKALEGEMFRLHEQIQAINEQIEQLKRQELQDHSQMNDVESVISRLRGERDDLMGKLQHLNRTYDNCV